MLDFAVRVDEPATNNPIFGPGERCGEMIKPFPLQSIIAQHALSLGARFESARPQIARAGA
ncbi:MAG: hypothetical protein EBV30_11565 [Actinobacteria bacterium]|nr:hypothetical protein [Actinomycetota bacterium]